MKKRILASFLSLVLVLSLVPMSALAADENDLTGGDPVPVCTCETLCTAEAVNMECPICAENIANCMGTAPADEPVGPTVEEQLAELIAALPDPADINPLDEEQVAAVNDQISEIYAFAEKNGLDVENEETINAVIAALSPVETTEPTSDLLIGSAPTNAGNTLEGAAGSDLTWALADGTLTISGTGAMKDYGYSGRTEVPWYEQRTTITKVVFEAGVTHIGGFAFYQHTALTSFEMADSVVSFGQGAFQGCSALTTIPELHADFQDFSTEVFVDARISEYRVDTNNSNYTVKDGILYSKDGTTLINCPPGKMATFDQNWLNGVTTIAPYAFRTCKNLTGNLVIPAHITSIGRQAFQNCSGLTGDLTVPNTVTDLDGYYAFAGMSNMEGKLTLDSNITEIAGGMFNGSGFTSMEWKGAVTSVGDNAFVRCKFTNFVLPDSLTTVGVNAFIGCSSNTSFGDLSRLTSIGKLAFQNCKFENITLSNNAVIAEQAFNGCTIDDTLTVSEGVSVGDKAFWGTTIGTVDYRAPVWSDNVFQNATIKTKVILADSVTDIGSGSFAGQNTTIEASLKNVTNIGNNVFKGTTFVSDISIPAGATVGSNAFENAKLKKVSYNAEAASYAAFKGATMDSLILGDNTKKIDSFAFQSSKIGGDVLKLGKVETIEKYAFQYATLPATVIVPETATYYNNHVFFNVTGGKTLLIYGTYNMVPTALTHGSSFETVVITADIVDNEGVKYGDNQNAHNRLTSMPEGHIIYMTNDTSRTNAKVPNNNGTVGVTNGGTFAEDTVFESGKLATPIKDGAIFDGWYANAEFTGEKVTTASSNKTYYAKWIELTADTITLEYGSTSTDFPTIDGVSLTGWTSADPAIVEIKDGKMIATGVGTTTITASAALTRSGETLTVNVEVTPMPITFGTGDGENPHSTITYQFTGTAPEFSDFAIFYPAKVEDGQVSVVEDSKAVTLTEGTDIVFEYDAGGGKNEYHYLPIDVTADQTYGIEVTVKLVNKNYRFVTSTNTTLSDTIKENVIVKAEGKTEVSIIGLPAVGENPSYAYTGKAIAPIGNLTRITAGTIDKFTVHFHPWGDTDFDEAHLTEQPASALTPEAIANIAPTEPGSYLMIVDGTNDTQYVYQSWIFTITKATVTICPNDKSAYVGDAVPVLGENDYTVTGLADGETLTKAPTLAYASTPDMNTTGTYAIKASGAEVNEAHYTLVYEDGTLTVSRRSSGGGGGSSSSSTTTETERNPDGSTTTTVTDKKTGTVTETTKFKDGSTLVVETKKDGTITTTETAKNGVKVRTVDEPGEDVTAKVTIPCSVGEAVVTIPADVDYGTVAVDADTGEIVKLSVPTEDGMTVKLDGSAELVLVERSLDFTDTNNHWAEDAIDFATAHELFAGTSDTTFSPDSSMTRAMLMTVLARFDGQDTTGGAVWYEKAMAWAKENGISDGSNPDGNITREQFATMLWRYAGSPAVSGMALNEFGDSASVNGYAVDAMRWAVSSGIIGGTDAGLLMPQGNATRAQVATMLMRFVEGLTK